MTERSLTKIIIADDHELIIMGMKTIIDLNPDWEVTGTAQTGQQCINALTVKPCDLLLLDYVLPDMNGLDIVGILRPKYPDLRFIIISSSFDQRLVSQIRESGVQGFINKSEIREKIAYAINEVIKGNKYFSEMSADWGRKEGIVPDNKKNAPGPFSKLTSREIEIVKLLATGISQKDISEKLNIAAKTVEVHKYNIHLKMGKISDAELTRQAYIWKLISDPYLISIHGSVTNPENNS